MTTSTSLDLSFGGLQGTLLLPGQQSEAQTPLPVVLLLTGSGPIDRDSNHKRMRLDVTRQLAEALAAAGVASFRYDRRGVSTGTGDWRVVGFHDNTQDARAALAMLRGRPEIDPARIFVVGHSEGAVHAVALGAHRAEGEPPLAGIGLLAGAARSGEQVLVWQAGAISATLPSFVRRLLALLRVDPVARVRKNHAKLKASTTDTVRMDLATMNAKWFREFMAYDPAADLPNVTIPVLAITGEKDLQVPPEDVARIGALAGGEVETHLVPDVTHILRHQPGVASMSKYKEEIRRPVDSGVLGLVTDWVRRHC